jgi:hypothetical protein
MNKRQIIILIISLFMAFTSCEKKSESKPTEKQLTLISKIIDNVGPFKGQIVSKFKWEGKRLIEAEDVQAKTKYVFNYSSSGKIESLHDYDLVTNKISETFNQLKYDGDLVTQYTHDQIGNNNYRIYKLSYQNSKLSKSVTEFYYRNTNVLFQSSTTIYNYDDKGNLINMINHNGYKNNFTKVDNTKKSVLDFLPVWFYTPIESSVHAFWGISFQNFLPRNEVLLEATGSDGDNHKYTYEFNEAGYPTRIKQASTKNGITYSNEDYTYEYIALE